MNELAGARAALEKDMLAQNARAEVLRSREQELQVSKPFCRLW